MRNSLFRYALYLLMIGLLHGCAILPWGKNVRVRKAPDPVDQITISNYDLKKSTINESRWWAAWSDRDPNNTCISPSNDMTVKKLSFMEPVYVVKQKGNYVKIIQRSEDMDLSASKGKVAKKAAKNFGWIKKDRLLSSSFALKDKITNFSMKAIAKLNGAEVMKKAAQYLINDSLAVFTSPKLSTPSGNNVQPGSIVYIYKQSEDKKSFLIGKEADFTLENAKQNILGWISRDAITAWGTRSAFTWSTDSLNANALYGSHPTALLKDSLMLLSATTAENRSLFENIFPIQNNDPRSDSVLNTAYLDNIMDYTKNDIYNVLGNIITYDQYKNIVRNGKRVNVVFVLDASSNNRLYFPYVKSVIQDLQLYFDTTTLVRHYKFGAVTYKQTKCKADTLVSAFGLTDNFKDIEQYLESKLSLASCNDETAHQPVYRGLTDACNLLKPVKNETNIIVLVGTTGNIDTDENKYPLDNIINRITDVRARLLLFQSISKNNDAYNDFVLNGEKIITNSANNIGELKKEVLVDIKDVILAPSYAIQAGDSGVYSLDYPIKSMSQGFILFPKKGDVMPVVFLKNYFDTLVTQVMADNRRISLKLTNYFNNIGIKSTSYKPEFTGYTFGLPLPQQYAKAFNETQRGFFIPSYIAAKPIYDSTKNLQYGILVNEKEYDRLMEQFYTIYSKTASSETFRQRKAYRRYKRYIRRYVKQNNLHPTNKIKHLTLSEVMYLYSGYISTDTTDNKIVLTSLKKQKILDWQTVLTIFNNFKYAADAMQENKNIEQMKIYNNGGVYYWLNSKIMPEGILSRKKEED